MLKVNLFLVTIQIILLSLVALFGLNFGELGVAIYLSILIYILTLWIVNYKKTNIINLSTFFLLGFGVLIYGRLFAYLITPSIYSLSSLFCLEFFLGTCLNPIESTYSLLFFNFSLITFSFAYLSSKKKEWNIDLNSINNKKLKYIITLAYLLSIIKIFNSYSVINTALTDGYMALYQSQAEAYEPPYILALNAIYLAILAVLFSQRSRNNTINIHFNYLFYLTISISLLGIMTGSRSSFIGGILALTWYLFHNKKLSNIFYISLSGIAVILISLTDYIASLSGARDFNTDSKLLASVSKTLYTQGSTFLIADAATKLDSPPFLGYIKTVLPGIQTLFPLFNIVNRHEFDWSSYLAYSNNPSLYNSGFGLGWSIWADFYLLSFSFLPLYAFTVFFWGRYVNNLDKTHSPFNQSLAFILVLSIFSLSRNSLSPLIFTLISYAIILFFIRGKIRP